MAASSSQKARYRSDQQAQPTRSHSQPSCFASCTQFTEYEIPRILCCTWLSMPQSYSTQLQSCRRPHWSRVTAVDLEGFRPCQYHASFPVQLVALRFSLCAAPFQTLCFPKPRKIAALRLAGRSLLTIHMAAMLLPAMPPLLRQRACGEGKFSSAFVVLRVYRVAALLCVCICTPSRIQHFPNNPLKSF